MNVFGEVKEIFLGINEIGFEAGLEKAAETLVFFIKIHSVSDHEALHEHGDGILFSLFDKEMKMIGH